MTAPLHASSDLSCALNHIRLCVSFIATTLYRINTNQDLASRSQNWKPCGQQRQSPRTASLLAIAQVAPSELIRWTTPPSGIRYTMLASSELKGGHIDDGTDQYSGDRLGEEQFPDLHNGIGWG